MEAPNDSDVARTGRSSGRFDESPPTAFATVLLAGFVRCAGVRSPLGLLLVLLGSLAVSLWATPIRAQVAVPFTQNDLSLNSLSSEVSYTVDLSTLPERPRMTATVVPDASHGDMSLQVEISGCNLVNPSGSCPATTLSSPGIGPRSVSYEPWRCVVGTTFPAYVGRTCNVRVRALDFGSAGAPARFDLSIRAVTVVPTSTISASITSNPVQTVSIAPTKDTTIYQSSTVSSNGAGDSFWAAAGTGGNALHALLDFDVANAVPAGATILAARLELTVVSFNEAPRIAVHAVPRNIATAWSEGAGNATGDESVPPGPVTLSATWSHREWNPILPRGLWSTAGGDRQLPALLTDRVGRTGLFVTSSPELLAHVTLLASTSASHDGLLLLATGGDVRFASDENPSNSQRPRLAVDYTIPPSLASRIPTTTATFINENQDFRWIYDLDQDDVLITPVLGRCEDTDIVGFSLPYTYQFQGSPSFTGVDCCTWQLDSATGISGTGQALFFVNVDASNPANQPADSDIDGIKNLCDNCPSVPNGPLLGSCISGSRAGSLCRSNQECSGGLCSFAQDDADLDGVGNACVPEPSVGAGLASGLIGMAWRCRRRRFFQRRLACPARNSTE